MTDPSRQFLRHAVATLAYRGSKVVRNAPAHFASWQVGETTRTPAQILAHVGDLLERWPILRRAAAPPSKPPAGWSSTARATRGLSCCRVDAVAASRHNMALQAGKHATDAALPQGLYSRCS